MQDAPTTNDHDCRDAKPTKRSYSDREFALFLYRLFLQTESDRAFLSDLFLYAFKIPFGSVLEGSAFFILRVAVKAKLSGVIGDRVIFKSGKFS